ncbi:Serine/threonine-protein kinase PknB [Rubripirellula amarantea]|uniref:Serine/threonine-protein kinase PknB n=1 Tax=Rubripirellula amarantea TaxID=2527999 RepID=A0A5C5WYX3_9BACT|nr:serine/threonine-protein kinase [Rubripirellula amarantea]TWT55115.1 Serine/threonine-protein kinase PknB [Rubripirellula amarantea]
MKLYEMSAADLAIVDQLCLDYESQLRQAQERGTNAPSIEQFLDRYESDHGGKHRDELREELQSIYEEVVSSSSSSSTHSTHPPSDQQRSSGTGANGKAVDPDCPNASNNRDFQLPKIGDMLGRYTIQDVLGRGGMGVVYGASDHRLNRRVAIKTLTAEIARREDLTERFEREARAVAAISHPHIVELFDVGCFGGLPYAVMEFLDGVVLEDVLEQGRLPAKEVRRLGSQIADALATAHAAGVIHRDLKPQNIMLVKRGDSDSSIDSIETAKHDTETMMVKLFDFGLSRVPTDEVANDNGQSSQGRDDRTREGMILGTPGYMAPEQALGEPVTLSADIFSLGCILHEAFYGKRAFEGTTKSARIRAVITDVPQSDITRRSDDEPLAELIDQCLQKEASSRPANAMLIAKILRNASDSSIATLSAPRSDRMTRRAVMGLGIAGVAASTVSGLSYFFPADTSLAAIESVAVLSFDDGSSLSSESRPGFLSKPIGVSNLSRGDMLAGLLVHELSQLPNLRVPKFQPLRATTPDEFRELGERLGVEALLTGTIQKGTNGKPFLDLQLISQQTGNQIWGKRVPLVSGESLLSQTRIAAVVAKVVGCELSLTHWHDLTKCEKSFECLIDGELRSEPDSPEGLKRAIMCFQRAHEADPDFAAPLAGLALTSITVAAQLPREEAVETIIQARGYVDQASKIDGRSVEVRLADAMLKWQTREKYEDANRELMELEMKAPQRWQIHHQFGLLQLTLGKDDQAIEHLRQAQLLNPFSISVQADLIRARWFTGDVERALADARRLLQKAPDNKVVRGLLVDIYEQKGDFQSIMGLIPELAASSPEEYFETRPSTLADLPYTPFGDAVNEMIWAARSETLSEDHLADFLDADSRTPMIAFILAKHPALQAARQFERAKEILPHA